MYQIYAVCNRIFNSKNTLSLSEFTFPYPLFNGLAMNSQSIPYPFVNRLSMNSQSIPYSFFNGLAMNSPSIPYPFFIGVSLIRCRPFCFPPNRNRPQKQKHPFPPAHKHNPSCLLVCCRGLAAANKHARRNVNKIPIILQSKASKLHALIYLSSFSTPPLP